MSDIKFSIIVPIYKVEKYINKCVDSLINQTYKNIEIILVDDESPDNCPQICDTYAKDNKNVRVFHKPNGGLSDARNFGLSKAIGEYIIFVDSDDFIEIDSCEKFNKLIGDARDVDIIASNSIRFGDTTPSNEMYTIIGDIITGKMFLKTQYKNRTMFVTAWRNVYKREFLIKNDLFFKIGILHEDEQWTPRVFLKAESVITTDFVFYHHNIREGSITQSKVKTKNAKDILSTCTELRPLYEKLDDNELKSYLLNYLVSLTLHAIYMGKLIDNKNYVDIEFLKKYAITKRLKRKVSLYIFSKKVFYYFIYVRTNFLSRSAIKNKLRMFN
ncbi:glycosyltransferase [Globicatella sulfidifaciens]|uniref:glycosyltransferase n=1 Tax=Globicatella sulfidifaciens TaxID=136093 RepID=UPI002891CE5B|nr:glycosyltransferase [Globicatella sulfidifaciens]MDT2767632.1 glycosyltransferase [Globicatella sulfidifaciens]